MPAGSCIPRWQILLSDQHQEIILSTIAKRAYQLFERRGCAHGLGLEDWITAESELLQNDFNGFDTTQADVNGVDGLLHARASLFQQSPSEDQEDQVILLVI